MKTFVIADLHFGDETVCSRRKLRKQFSSAHEMDAEIIERWNQSVTERDLVYVLGDIGRGSNARSVSFLNGRKRLVAGNGDNIAQIARLGLFESISVAKWLPKLLLTHIPVHPSELRGRAINVHGHLHGRSVSDARYVCVSVEQTDFRPVELLSIITSE